MKKAMSLLLLTILLVGCSNDAAEEKSNTDQENKTEDVTNDRDNEDDNTNEADEENTEALSIDADKFEKQYNKYAKKFDLNKLSEDGTIQVNNETIEMVMGSLTKLPVFINAIADTVDKSDRQDALDVIDNVTDGLDQDGYYINDIELTNQVIHVNAIDASNVSIKVKEG